MYIGKTQWSNSFKIWNYNFPFYSLQFGLFIWIRIEEIGEDGVDSFVYDRTFTHWVVSIGNI